MLDPNPHQIAAKLATMLAFYGVRNSCLEDLHAGTFPRSQTGDYEDVTVRSPYGEIAWPQVSRISDEEMRQLMQEIVNRLYTFLVHFLQSGEPDRGLPLPKHWAPPQMDAATAGIWHGSQRW